MNDSPAPTRRKRLLWPLLLGVAALLTLTAGAIYGWHSWQSQLAQYALENGKQRQRLQALEQNLETLRHDQRTNRQSIQDAAATNRVLRDELLGLGQRNALIEQTVSRLADSERHGAQSLRADEVELLLSHGEQRLAIAGDLDGARRAYALAAGILEGIDDPAYLNLRQTLVQERLALDAAGQSPQANLGAALERFVASLQQLPERTNDAPQPQPWWQKALSPLVQIRPSHGNVLVARSQRIGAHDALQIEISLARAALERNDEKAYQQALQRISTWLTRLWPDSPQLRQHRSDLDKLTKTPLRTPIPELGSTLRQLQSMREARTES